MVAFSSLEFGLEKKMDFQEWAVTVVIGLFILFLLCDISRDIAKQPKKWLKWIPGGKVLVLSGFIVHLVGYLEWKNVDISGQRKEQQMKSLIENQLFINGDRACLCVFLGYIQLEIVSPKSAGWRWIKIAAQLFNLFLHVVTEIVSVLQSKNITEAGKLRNEVFVSSSVVSLVGAVCLVLYLGLTILAGKFIRESLSRRMPWILPQNLPEGHELSRFRKEMLKLWTLAFAWEAQCKLAISAFVPAVGMIVTICVTVVASNSARLLLHHGGDLKLVFYLQCTFVVLGWIAILYRWFNMVASSYLLSRFMITHTLIQYTNRFKCLYFRYIEIKLNFRQHMNESCLKRVLWAFVALLTRSILFTVWVTVWAIPTLVITLLFLFSYISWDLSVLCGILLEGLFLLGKFIVLADKPEEMICTQESLAAAAEEDEEFLKCEESLKQMFQGVHLDESVECLLNWHVKSYNQIRSRMKEAYQSIQKSQELVRVFTVGENNGIFLRALQNSNLQLKTVAVALIDTMVRLRTELGWDVDVKDMIKAYKEIKDLLEFMDCPENIDIDPTDMFGTGNFEAIERSLEADKQLSRIEKEIQQHGGGDARRAGQTCSDVNDFIDEEHRKEDLQKKEWEAAQTYWSDFRKIALEITSDIDGPFIEKIEKLLANSNLGRVTRKLIRVNFRYFSFCQQMVPVNYLSNSVGGCLGRVVKCLWFVVVCLIPVCIILISTIPSLLIIALDTIVIQNVMGNFGYDNGDALKESRIFVYGFVLERRIDNNSENGRETITRMGNKTIGCFRELIRCCVRGRLGESMIEHSKKCAGEFETEKISKLLELGEKVKALTEMYERVKKERGQRRETRIGVRESE